MFPAAFHTRLRTTCDLGDLNVVGAVRLNDVDCRRPVASRRNVSDLGEPSGDHRSNAPPLVRVTGVTCTVEAANR